MQLAVVIGNSRYIADPLANPPKDAKAVALRLGELGFEVLDRVDEIFGWQKASKMVVPILDVTKEDVEALVEVVYDRIGNSIGQQVSSGTILVMYWRRPLYRTWCLSSHQARSTTSTR